MMILDVALDKRRGLILMRILIYGAGVIGSLYAALFGSTY